jgi:hypothetical protein
VIGIGCERPFCVVTNVKNRYWNAPADPNHPRQPKRRRIGFLSQSGKKCWNLTLPSHSLAILYPAAFCKSCC